MATEHQVVVSWFRPLYRRLSVSAEGVGEMAIDREELSFKVSWVQADIDSLGDCLTSCVTGWRLRTDMRGGS